MNWEDFMPIGVLLAVGFLVIRNANFKININYLMISLAVIAVLWGFFRYMGYS